MSFVIYCSFLNYAVASQPTDSQYVACDKQVGISVSI